MIVGRILWWADIVGRAKILVGKLFARQFFKGRILSIADFFGPKVKWLHYTNAKHILSIIMI